MMMDHKYSSDQPASAEAAFLALCSLAHLFDGDIHGKSPDPTEASVSQPPLAQFQWFPLLPAELRLRIWELAQPGPRVLSRVWNNGKFQFCLLGPVPKFLHVCRETRQWFVYRRQDDKILPNKYQIVRQKPGEDGGVFLNWMRDDVFIDRGFNVHDSEIAQLEKLRSLTMTWGQRPCWVKYSISSGVEFIRRFPHLQQLTLRVKFVQQYMEDCSRLSEKHAAKSRNHELRVISAMVLAEFQLARSRDPEWKAPGLRVVECE